MKLICIGNSIVNGFPFERRYSFPSILDGYSGLTAVNKGINGQSTDQILARFEKDVVCSGDKCDVVLILTGANDFMFEINSPAAAAENIMAMTELAQTAGITPVAATPLMIEENMAKQLWMPEMHLDYPAANNDLRELALLLKSRCQERDIKLIDTQMEYAGCGKYIDGVHPDEDGQRFLAEIIRNELK